jgi:hypothetical protein
LLQFISSEFSQVFIPVNNGVVVHVHLLGAQLGRRPCLLPDVHKKRGVFGRIIRPGETVTSKEHDFLVTFIDDAAPMDVDTKVELHWALISNKLICNSGMSELIK